ncbi:hypothetical protein CCH79_00002408, partial [Gambusia affinis]
ISCSVMQEAGHSCIRQDQYTICWVSVMSCLLLASFYVGSLYACWSTLPRDHPRVIKRRSVSVFLVSAVSPACVKLWMHWADITFFYLGPLVQSALDNPDGFSGELHSALGIYKVLLEKSDAKHVQSWRMCVQDAAWLRSQVVAPVTEELVFRGAMLPMLVPCTGATAVIFIAPLFFGVAHLHHIIEELHLGKDNVRAIFLGAGHIVGPVLCHSFCNSQGLPDIGSALSRPQRSAVLICYLTGVLLFLVVLFPFTDPFLYGARPVCSLAASQALEC